MLGEDEGTISVANAGTPYAQMTVNASGFGYGASNMIDVDTGDEQYILVPIDGYTSGAVFTLQIDEEVNGTWRFLTNAVVSGTEDVHLIFTPDVSQVKFTIVRSDHLSGSKNLRFVSIRYCSIHCAFH